MLETLKQMKASYDEIKKESEFYPDQGNLDGVHSQLLKAQNCYFFNSKKYFFCE